MLLLFKKTNTLSKIIFSKIFPQIGNSEICWILAYFQKLRNVSEDIHFWKIICRGIATFEGHTWSIATEIWSYPWDLFALRLEIISIICFSVIRKREMDLFVLGMYAGNTIPLSLIVHSLNILAFRKKSYIIYIYANFDWWDICLFHCINNSFKCNPKWLLTYFWIRKFIP